MKQLDLFGPEGIHELSRFVQLDPDGLTQDYRTVNIRKIHAAFGTKAPSAELLAQHPQFTRGQLKFRKKLVLIQEFVLTASEKAKARIVKKQGDVASVTDSDPQYLINLYEHTENVALFCRDFEDFMKHFMNALHIFTAATIYDGRLLVYAENGTPLVTEEETLSMLDEIERHINRSKVYRVLSSNSIYRTI